MKTLERIAILFMGLAFLGEMNLVVGREVIHNRAAILYMVSGIIFIMSAKGE